MGDNFVTPLIAEKIEAAVNRLTLQDILDAQDIKYENLEVPEWGGYITIRTLTAGAVTDIIKEATVEGEENGTLSTIYLIAAGVHFPTITREAAQMLWDTKGMAAMMRVGKALRKLNGIGKEAQEAAEHSFPVQPGRNGAGGLHEVQPVQPGS